MCRGKKFTLAAIKVEAGSKVLEHKRLVIVGRPRHNVRVVNKPEMWDIALIQVLCHELPKGLISNRSLSNIHVFPCMAKTTGKRIASNPPLWPVTRKFI